jgi:hypothetical protein
MRFVFDEDNSVGQTYDKEILKDWIVENIWMMEFL